jgi:hypothetical protein
VDVSTSILAINKFISESEIDIISGDDESMWISLSS